jgi:hypothetical protein
MDSMMQIEWYISSAKNINLDVVYKHWATNWQGQKASNEAVKNVSYTTSALCLKGVIKVYYGNVYTIILQCLCSIV